MSGASTAQAGEQRVLEAATQAQRGAAAQQHFVIALEERRERFHLGQVHGGGFVDAHEALFAELREQIPEIDAVLGTGEVADIVILTNIGDDYQANRVAQLEAFDIRHRVLCNRGGKGRPVQELIDEMKPSATVFVDDLSVHHESVAKHAPDVWRLHMIAEPRLAATTPPAPHAHARIDDWGEALPWILEKLG